MKKESWRMEDGTHLAVRIWDEVISPIGVIQIIHGMAEHIGRYDDFATFLNQNKLIAVGDDHRAHGETSPNSLGLAGGGDLFARSVNDEREITKMLKEKYNLPVVVLGHSYGSLLLQRYLTLGADGIAGCILSGSAAMQGFTVNMGYKIAASKCKKGKEDEPGEFFANSTFVKYDKKIKDGINGWLSRDVEQVGKYNLDKACGFSASNGFYKSMLGGLITISRDNGGKIDKNLKMLIASGSKDCFGGCGKLVIKLFDRYKAQGLTPELKIYEGARHEILNEINKGEVYTDFVNFAKKCIIM